MNTISREHESDTDLVEMQYFCYAVDYIDYDEMLDDPTYNDTLYKSEGFVILPERLDEHLDNLGCTADTPNACEGYIRSDCDVMKVGVDSVSFEAYAKNTDVIMYVRHEFDEPELCKILDEICKRKSVMEDTGGRTDSNQ
jgi:hypothetical protein